MSRPTLADEIARRLWVEAGAPGPADLGRHLVLVPTAQAGRLLRDALGRLAERESRPLVPPQILTPEDYADRSLEGLPVASALDSLAALAAVLLASRPGDFPALFPQFPRLGSHDQALACAEPLLALRSGLGENGLDCAGVLARLPGEHPERARWQDLARLETLFRANLARHRLTDRQDARARLLLRTEPVLPCAHLWLAAVPDPQPLLLEHFRKLDPAPRLQVVTLGENSPGHFDAWGVPLPDLWTTRAPAWADFAAQTHLLATPAEAAPWFLARASGEKPSPAHLTIGLLSPDLLPPLREALAKLGTGLHEPGGRPFSRHWTGQLLALVADLAEDPAFRLLPRLLAFPAVAAWAAENIPGFNLSHTLEGLDDIAQKHLPDTLGDALELGGWETAENQGGPPPRKETQAAVAFLRLIAAWRSQLLSGPPAPRLAAWFAGLARHLPAGSDPFLEKAGETLALELQHLPELAERHGLEDAADQIRLLLRGLARVTLAGPSEPAAVSALGWLELLWDDAPHLILAGLNEGLVPASPGPDPFLPDSLRTLLGLRNRASRHARDTALLDALLRRRAGTGRVDCLILQTAANGDPLRPSRLLLQGAGAELPGRVLQLFREPAPSAPEPAWQAGWKLSPTLAAVKPEPRVSVTDFKGYLDCPFRFYLRKHLGMQPFDAAKGELDARDFGDLLHFVFEQFGRDAEAARMGGADEILAWTEHRLRQRVRHVYGETLPLSVLVQQEAAVNRLQGFARHQAALREEGWEIMGVERSFADTLTKPWQLEGWEIRGRFDRLDRHPDGRWRVIDYKTADRAETPAQAHWSRPRANDPWPAEYARGERLNDKGKQIPFVWTNLQLPLYVELLTASGLPAEKVSAAYFNLPKALADAGVAEFSELSAGLRESAMHCARGVLADLAARRFWPPREKPAFDDFKVMLSPGPARVVEAAGLDFAAR